MRTKYENRDLWRYRFRYIWNIEDISRMGDSFSVSKAGNVTEETDYRTAVFYLVGIYVHFLKTGGRAKRNMIVVKEPERICLNVTKDDRPNGEPVLSEQETIDCLGSLLHGLYCFSNKRCRNTEVARGLAYMIRKLYEPYMRSSCREIHDIYYAIIARGLFSFQMNNEILARSIYKGLYGTWEYARERQEFFFDGMSLEAIASFDNIMEHENVDEDAIHDSRKYPWNMYAYNIDDLILTFCAAKEYLDAASGIKGISEKDITGYRLIMDFIYDFMQKASALYKARCDYFNKRRSDYVHGIDPVEEYGNITDLMKKYKAVPVDLAPYLYYSCYLFNSKDDLNTWKYVDIAEKYTGRRYGALDRGCPILGERYRSRQKRKETADAFLKVFNGGVIIVLIIYAILLIAEWQMRTHGLTKIFLGALMFGGLCAYGKAVGPEE